MSAAALATLLLLQCGILTAAMSPLSSVCSQHFPRQFNFDNAVDQVAKSSGFPMGFKREEHGSHLPELTATNILVGINIVIHLAQMAFPSLRLKSLLIQNDIMIARRGEIHRFFTSTFLHLSFDHIVMNMYSLHSLGNELERKFGTVRFLATYLTSGILANIATYFLPRTSLYSPLSAGASGCLFGLLGAHMTYCVVNKAILGEEASEGV